MKWKKNALTTEPKFICDVFVGLSPQMLEKQTIKTTKEIEGKRIKSCTNKMFGPIQLSVLFMNENDGVSYVWIWKGTNEHSTTWARSRSQKIAYYRCQQTANVDNYIKKYDAHVLGWTWASNSPEIRVHAVLYNSGDSTQFIVQTLQEYFYSPYGKKKKLRNFKSIFLCFSSFYWLKSKPNIWTL